MEDGQSPAHTTVSYRPGIRYNKIEHGATLRRITSRNNPFRPNQSFLGWICTDGHGIPAAFR